MRFCENLNKFVSNLRKFIQKFTLNPVQSRSNNKIAKKALKFPPVSQAVV